jgi:TRAP-type uncharacterized transport system substrate-binding protein
MHIKRATYDGIYQDISNHLVLLVSIMDNAKEEDSYEYIWLMYNNLMAEKISQQAL